MQKHKNIDTSVCYNCKTTKSVTADTIGDVNLPPMCPACKVKFIKYWSCKNCGAIRTKPRGKGWENSRWTACVPCHQRRLAESKPVPAAPTPKSKSKAKAKAKTR